MLALRQLAPRTLLRRALTLQTASTAQPSPPPPIPPRSAPAPGPAAAVAAAAAPDDAAPRPRRKRAYRKRTRPQISPAHPRAWNRPLAPGVLPAYDEALALIRRDAALLKQEAAQLRADALAADARGDAEAARELRRRHAIVEVQSEVNLPDVRWRCANSMVDMSLPVHRHLVEHRWRKEGGLDLLMERIHQMHVVPDVLPDLHPSIELHLTALSSAEDYRATGSMYKAIEPGTFLLPHQTRKPPKLYANVFHTDTRLYTLLMVDPDIPDESTQSFQTYLHWLQPNIPLSATQRNRIQGLHTHTRYIPPHPQRGTPYHRYVLLLLPQTTRLSIPVVPDAERLGFNVREFTALHGLDGATGGGAHMWREVWSKETSEEVSAIYRDVLKAEEPRYGPPPKGDRYADVKRIKRYI